MPDCGCDLMDGLIDLLVRFFFVLFFFYFHFVLVSVQVSDAVEPRVMSTNRKREIFVTCPLVSASPALEMQSAAVAARFYMEIMLEKCVSFSMKAPAALTVNKSLSRETLVSLRVFICLASVSSLSSISLLTGRHRELKEKRELGRIEDIVPARWGTISWISFNSRSWWYKVHRPIDLLHILEIYINKICGLSELFE